MSRKGDTHAPLAERFWRYVNKDGPVPAHCPDLGPCWVWTSVGSRSSFGYGTIGRGGRAGGTALAHRVSYELNRGPIPDGLLVLHKCDNPPCCNPEHLFLGTHADNTRDCVSKGRDKAVTHPEAYAMNIRGESHYRAELTEDQVREIRRRWADGETLDSLANSFVIARTTAYDITQRRTWKHVPGGGEDYVPRGRAQGERNGSSKLTAQNVREMRRRRDAGEKISSLSLAFGVNCSTVCAIVNRKSWSHVAA